jgi:hypothetical protein
MSISSKPSLSLIFSDENNVCISHFFPYVLYLFVSVFFLYGLHNSICTKKYAELFLKSLLCDHISYFKTTIRDSTSTAKGKKQILEVSFTFNKLPSYFNHFMKYNPSVHEFSSWVTNFFFLIFA